MLIVMTILAILGWLQAIRINQRYRALHINALLQIESLQRQNGFLQQQVAHASKWSNHE